MSERFTKGPWKVLNNLSYSDRKYHYQILTKDAGLWVANTEDCDNEEEEANAMLIATAPEMYDMLEEVKGKLDRSARISIGHSMGAGWSREQAKRFFMEYIEINKRIKAVLQKARGKQ